MKLPGFENAFVSIEKLRDYCLNTEHPIGKYKARAFKSKLDFDSSNAEELRLIILPAIKLADATESFSDRYGKRYIVDFTLQNSLIRTCWIIKSNETFPRLTSCYLKNK